MNTSHADILVYGTSTHPLALVEVKNISRLSLSQAKEVRNALVEGYGASGRQSYVLVVSQEAGYLWRPRPSQDANALPDARFGMRDVLGEYLTNRELDLHLRGAELELAIVQWLNDLSLGRGRLPSDEPAVTEFATAVRDSRVEGGLRA